MLLWLGHGINAFFEVLLKQPHDFDAQFDNA